MTEPVVPVLAAAYVGGLLALGVFASRRIATATDFIVAGRRLGPGLASFTLFATWFGGGTLIGAAGAAYSGGLSATVADPFGSALCLLLAGAFYVRLLRRMRLLTVPDFFRRRFGRAAEMLAALAMLPAYVGWVGSQLIAFGTVLNAMTGIPFAPAVLAAAAIVIVYTVVGGMWSVTLTDAFQTVVIVVALFVLFPVALGAAGGASAALDRLPDASLRFLPSGGLFEWMLFVQAWLLIGLGNLPGQDLMQRALSSKSERVAQWSAYVGGAAYLAVGLIPVGLGLLGSLLLPGLANPESVVPRLALEYLPPAGVAIFFGAVFSALMSSADSGLLAPAGVLARNVLPGSGGDSDGRRELRRARWAVIGFGALAVVAALRFESVYRLMVDSWTVLLVALFGPLTLGMYWRRANGPGAVAGILGGLGAFVLLSVLSPAGSGTDAGPPHALIAAAVSIALSVAVSLATGAARPPLPLTDVDGNPVSGRDRLGTLGLRERPAR